MSTGTSGRRISFRRTGATTTVGEHVDAPAQRHATADDNAAWRRAVVAGLSVYVVSRLCVLAGAAVRASQVAVDARVDGDTEPGSATTIASVLTSWDGEWYLQLIRLGYPNNVPPNITYEQLEARAAFFPLYPWTARVLDWILPGGDTLAALVLNAVLGAVAVVLVGVLARRLYDVEVATRAMLLFAIFPGSAILSFAYSEALLIVLAAACLIALVDERWLIAGVFAALATATRPNGLAVVAACAVASFLAIRRGREWRSLVSVALAPLGFVFFQWYVDHTAGERGVWFRVQREAWSEGTSFGLTALTNTFEFVLHPLSSPTDALTAFSVLCLIGLVYCAWKARLAWPVAAFCAVVVGLMLLPDTVTARPRFLYTAFPFFIAVAAWWPRPKVSDDRHDRSRTDLLAWDLTLVACGAGIVALTGLYAAFGVIP